MTQADFNQRFVLPSFWPLMGIFCILLIALLKQTASVFVPVVLALFLKLALEPVVRNAQRWYIPRPLSAALLILAVTGGVISGALLLSEPASQWLERAPESLKTLETKAKPIADQAAQVVKAKEQVEALADGIANTGEKQKPRELMVKTVPESVSIFDVITESMSTFAIMLVMLYFLLLGKGSPVGFIFYFVHGFSARRRVVRMAQQINRDVSRYMLRLMVINSCLGIIVALTMWLLGMPNPMLWGVLAAALNFIPYLGSIITATILAFVSMLSFDSINQALLPPIAYLVLTIIEGNFVTPAVHAQRMTVNPALVLFSIMFWYWMWGLPGVLMAVPMMAVLRMAARHIRHEIWQIQSQQATTAIAERTP